MDYEINFPHLGIYLEHVGKNIAIGNFTIAYYGIVIALRDASRYAGGYERASRPDRIGSLPGSYDIYNGVQVIGARIYYVVFVWDSYKDDLISVFNIRGGGLAIYGGIIAGAVTIFIICRKKKMNFGQVLDTCVLGLPIGQILGRWGNFLTGKFSENIQTVFSP